MSDKKDPKTFKYNNDEGLIFEQLAHTTCKGCVYAKPDVIVSGKVAVYGYKKAICEKYPDIKPNDILEDKTRCSFYKSK